MERYLINSKERAEKTFAGKYNVRLSIDPGDNWVAEEDLQHLKKHSKGFRHFIKIKSFVIETGENCVRDETDSEKKTRLTFMQKGKSLFSKNKPAPESEDAPPVDTKADLETFKKSLQEEAQTELNLFNDALRTASVTDEKKFAESLEKASSDILETKLKEFTASTNQLLKDQLQAFETQMNEKSKDQLETFETQVKAQSEDVLNVFVKKIEQLKVAKEIKFGKALDAAIAKAKKDFPTK